MLIWIDILDLNTSKNGKMIEHIFKSVQLPVIYFNTSSFINPVTRKLSFDIKTNDTWEESAETIQGENIIEICREPKTKAISF